MFQSFVLLFLRMVISIRGGGSGSGAGVEPIDERMQAFISSETPHNILE